jgi:hypothetical protein
MNAYDRIGQAYVELALRMNRHAVGFVDGYYGPPEWKAAIDAAPLPPVTALQDDAQRLSEAISQTEMDAQRRDFLTKQALAMNMVLRRLTGEDVPYVEEVRGCFDITPSRIPEAEFQAALRELDTLLPGTGDLRARQLAWKRRFELPNERVLPLADTTLAEVRRRTQTILALPADESVELKLVSGQPWAGYNWYLGQGRSRIEINTDLPVRADRLVNLMAHEAYPGHHTECVVKEERWYRQAGRLEHSMVLLLTPECVIGEGIATVAEDVIFPDKAELAAWLREVLYPQAGIQVDVDLQLRLAQAAEKLAGVSGNAAFLLHVDGRSEEEVLEYFRQYSLSTEQEARRSVNFISNPLFRAYTFTYFYGRRLLQGAFAASGMLDVFRWVIQEPVTPSALADRYGVSKPV